LSKLAGFWRLGCELAICQLEKPSPHLVVGDLKFACSCNIHSRSEKRGFSCVFVVHDVDLFAALGHEKKVAPGDTIVQSPGGHFLDQDQEVRTSIPIFIAIIAAA